MLLVIGALTMIVASKWCVDAAAPWYIIAAITLPTGTLIGRSTWQLGYIDGKSRGQLLARLYTDQGVTPAERRALIGGPR